MAKTRLVPGVVCLLSVMTLLAAPAQATTDEARWSRVNIPTEGEAGRWVLASGSDIRHLTMAIDGALYASGDGLSYTLYKSTDGGRTWRHTGNVTADIVAVAASPADAGAVYYATSSHVYRSTNGGASFTSLPPGPGGAGIGNISITSISVARRGGSHVIAAATRDADILEYGGIYTLDEGESFAWVDTSLGNYDAYAVAFSPDFASDGQLVAVVTDESDTLVTARVGEGGWGENFDDARLDRDNSGAPTPLAAVSADIAFPADYQASIDGSVLFVAIDTGSGNGDVYLVTITPVPGSSAATDLNISSAYGLSNVDAATVAASGSATAARLMAGAASSAQVYSSSDGGTSWTRSVKPPTGQAETHVLVSADFGTSGRAYAATSGDESAFSYTADGGATWNQTGLIDTSLSTILDVAPSPDYRRDGTLFMLTFGGEHSLWRSSDGGASWERVFSSALPAVTSLDRVALSPGYGGGSQAVFVAGASNGNPAVWKSTNDGRYFIPRSAYAAGAPLAIDAWVVADDNTLFIGSYDGSSGLVYRTGNSGLFYPAGATAGTSQLYSLALSPDYERDGVMLAGNTAGSVFWSNDRGASFQPLPSITGSITVAFDRDFSDNDIVYAASDTPDKGIFRLAIGRSGTWENIDSSLPGGGIINQLGVSPDGVLYAANSKAGGGMERSLDPSYSLGPAFETVTRGLDDGAKLVGLWQSGNQLWSMDTANTRLMTFADTLTAPVTLTSPSEQASSLGTVINHAVSNISLDWETLAGATSYQWQLDHDTDFSSVPAGFEGTTRASTVRLPSLEPATTYYWRVRAAAPVLSPWSARWSFTTSLEAEAVQLELESPPAGAVGVPPKPVFQWSAIAGADAYEMLVSADASFASPIIIKIDSYALPATAWQSDTGLEYSTTYYWKVRARSASSYSAWSGVSAFTTQPAPAPPPLQLPAAESLPPMPQPAPAPETPPAGPPPSPAPTSPAPAQPSVPPSAQSTAPELMTWFMGIASVFLAIMVAILVTLIILTVRISRL
ncbi:MAG: hypothetical protein HY530_07940 [Chloroflexi bacterium]|nr:hypothetical protein [Chloroflexota bacterium]